MYLVGIDISKYKHDCFIMTKDGEVIKDSFSFKNTRDGFEVFFNALRTLDQEQEIRIGLESTGHYSNSTKQLSLWRRNPIKEHMPANINYIIP